MGSDPDNKLEFFFCCELREHSFIDMRKERLQIMKENPKENQNVRNRSPSVSNCFGLCNESVIKPFRAVKISWMLSNLEKKTSESYYLVHKTSVLYCNNCYLNNNMNNQVGIFHDADLYHWAIKKKNNNFFQRLFSKFCS